MIHPYLPELLWQVTHAPEPSCSYSATEVVSQQFWLVGWNGLRQDAALADDPFNLRRFVEAQEGTYPNALAEIMRGAKRGHWMWFIFLQLRGLGRSETAHRFGKPRSTKPELTFWILSWISACGNALQPFRISRREPQPTCWAQ